MERHIYQVTETDQQKADVKAREYQARLIELELHREDKAYWRRRRTTFGLMKRDLSALALQGDLEYQRGRGQGLLDQLAGLDYHEERLSSAYNAGYHQGYLGSVNEMRDWIARNPNFDWWRASAAVPADLEESNR